MRPTRRLTLIIVPAIVVIGLLIIMLILLPIARAASQHNDVTKPTQQTTVSVRRIPMPL
jgi:hypothetical protein